MPKGASSRIRLPSQRAPPWGRMASPNNVMTRDLARGGLRSRKWVDHSLRALLASLRIVIVVVMWMTFDGRAQLNPGKLRHHYAGIRRQAEICIRIQESSSWGGRGLRLLERLVCGWTCRTRMVLAYRLTYCPYR